MREKLLLSKRYLFPRLHFYLLSFLLIFSVTIFSDMLTMAMPKSFNRVKSEMFQYLRRNCGRTASSPIQSSLFTAIVNHEIPQMRENTKNKFPPPCLKTKFSDSAFVEHTRGMSSGVSRPLKSILSLRSFHQQSSPLHLTYSLNLLSPSFKFTSSSIQKTNMITVFSKANNDNMDRDANTDNKKEYLKKNINEADTTNLYNIDSMPCDDVEEYEEYDDEGEYYEPEDNEKQTSGTISLRNSQATLDLDLKLIYRQIQFLLQKIGKDDHDVSLWLTNDEIIQDYNQQYRGMDKPTDILSFPFHTYLSPEVVDPNSGFPISLVNNGDDMDDVDLDDDLEEEMNDRDWDVDYDEHGNPIDKSKLEYDEDEKEMMKLLNKSLKRQELESQQMMITGDDGELEKHEHEQEKGNKIVMEYEEDKVYKEENMKEQMENLTNDDLQKLGVSFEQNVEWTRIPPGYIMKDLGDMIISIDYVLAQCKDDQLNAFNSSERGASGAMAKCTTVQERIPYLLIHGLLHLQGYDHETEEDYELMVKKEEELIHKFEKEFTL